MKVYILEEKDGFMVLAFEYVVPADPLSEGDLLFPAVPYMRSAPSSVPNSHIQVALNHGTENERWEAVVDLRGTTYWVDGVPYVIQKIGEEVPEGASLIPPEAIPSVVSMRQARLALLQAGLLASVNTTVASGSEADKIAWEYATEVRRDDVLVQNLSVSLGLTSDQLDTLFTTAFNL